MSALHVTEAERQELGDAIEGCYDKLFDCFGDGDDPACGCAACSSKRLFEAALKFWRVEHVGMFSGRTKHNELERAFAEAWQADNSNPAGTLNILLGTETCPATGGTFPAYITQRDATIAATVIQWLGTNGGKSFLQRVFAECGYRIIKEDLAG